MGNLLCKTKKNVLSGEFQNCLDEKISKNELIILIKLDELEKLEYLLDFNDVIQTFLALKKDMRKISIKFTNSSENIFLNLFVKFYYSLICNISELMNEEVSLHLQDTKFFLFRKPNDKRQSCYIFLISKSNKLILENEQRFFFLSYMEPFYLNELSKEKIKYIDDCLSLCKNNHFKYFQNDLILKLKDFHIYLDFKDVDFYNDIILPNLNNLFFIRFKNSIFDRQKSF